MELDYKMISLDYNFDLKNRKFTEDSFCNTQLVTEDMPLSLIHPLARNALEQELFGWTDPKNSGFSTEQLSSKQSLKDSDG